LTWLKIKQIAFGELGFTPEDLERYQPEYFRIKLEGVRNAQTQQFRNEWERTRWLATVMLSPHGKKGRPIKPKDLITFDWEKKDLNIVEVVTKYKHIFDKLRPS
jgi:hypothetical protein